MGGERHVEKFPHGVGKKLLPFPEKIMMMRDGRHPRFGNDFRNGDTQGDIQRYGQRIFRDQKIDIEFSDKGIQVFL